jgi:hypothetical protein
MPDHANDDAVWRAESVPVKVTDAERAATYANLSPVADRYVLDDEVLPSFKAAEPELAHQLLGDFQLKSVVYDPEYRVVTKALQPGPYGVAIEITPEADRKLATTRRFLTLFRLSKGKRLGAQNADAALDLPAQFEVPPGESPATPIRTRSCSTFLAHWTRCPNCDSMLNRYKAF